MNECMRVTAALTRIPMQLIEEGLAMEVHVISHC